MPKLMKSMVVISRCQAAYKNSLLEGGELSSCHSSFVFAICKNPGLTQEEISRRTCLNKSTVARRIDYLEERGFVERRASEADRRVFLVYPTEKMLAVYPQMREITGEWNRLISEGISEEELSVFRSVLYRLEERARELVGFSGGGANE